MPKRSDIKVHNTQALIEVIEDLCQRYDLKRATKGGAGMSVFINAMLDIALNEGIDVARRNLDRAIELLQTMRTAPHAAAMVDAATDIALRHNAEVRQRTEE